MHFSTIEIFLKIRNNFLLILLGFLKTVSHLIKYKATTEYSQLNYSYIIYIFSLLIYMGDDYFKFKNIHFIRIKLKFCYRWL